MLKLILLISKGLIRDARTRRTLMFYTVLAALLMLFFGATLLWGWLYEHKVVFVIYWFACAWITMLAGLLAIFDMLVVRAAGRRARKRLESEILKSMDEHHHEP